MYKFALLPLLFALALSARAADSLPAYRDPDLPVESRVEDLLRRMTPEEKFWQLFMIPGEPEENDQRFKHGIFGLQVATTARTSGDAAQIMDYGSSGSARQHAEKINNIQRYFVEQTRLGIPLIFFDEALHGLVRDGATAFPQAIALAATWNPQLVQQIAEAIAHETRSRGIRQILSPVVNLARDVRWGRVEETYGEDPCLSSRMGTAFVRGFEQQGVITTPKHFVANVGDGGRDSYPVGYSDWWLSEIYFKPFRACFQEGSARSVMTSYNSLNGRPCTANSWLLREVLKKRWGFNGFVISDAGAVGGLLDLHHTAGSREESAEQAIEAGLDVIFQTAYDHHIPLLRAVQQGRIDKAALDDAVRRVLRAKFQLGLFENPYADPAEADKWNGHPQHRVLALEAARESIVLLKNDNNLLPFSRGLKEIAVIGPDAVEGRLGGYSGPGNDVVTIVDGIKDVLGPQSVVRYAAGCRPSLQKFSAIPADYLNTTAAGTGEKGLLGRYYNGIALKGSPLLERVDPVLQFKWTLFAPHPAVPRGWFSAAWTGYLLAPDDVEVRIGLQGSEGFRLYIDDQLLVDRWKKISWKRATVPFKFEKGRRYRLRVEFYDNSGRSEIGLIWDYRQEDGLRQEMDEALKIASGADAVIMAAGIEEGEFHDRARLELPGNQVQLIKKLAALNKPLAVVLVGGSAITMENWLDEVPAVLDAWYPGEAGGQAVAEVLFGIYNPAGRLPLTFPESVAQVPLFYNHYPTGRGDDYADLSGFPQFPFGHGLSYSSFIYEKMELSPTRIGQGDSLWVSITLKNDGPYDGDEVVQLYMHDERSAIVRPVLQLIRFKRVHVKSGQTVEVDFKIAASELGYFDFKGKLVTEPGRFSLLAGSSSADMRLKETFSLVAD